jgi:low affinity Fe/Cu permease
MEESRQEVARSGKANDDRPDVFTRFTTRTAKVLGHAWVFIAAVVVLIVWACTGPLLGFSDTWQLVINTGTAMVTFLMVFIIQNTQDRDTAALHLKLDALMLERKVSNAKLYDPENEGEKEIERQGQRIEDDAGGEGGRA